MQNEKEWLENENRMHLMSKLEDLEYVTLNWRDLGHSSCQEAVLEWIRRER